MLTTKTKATTWQARCVVAADQRTNQASLEYQAQALKWSHGMARPSPGGFVVTAAAVVNAVTAVFDSILCVPAGAGRAALPAAVEPASQHVQADFAAAAAVVSVSDDFVGVAATASAPLAADLLAVAEFAAARGRDAYADADADAAAAAAAAGCFFSRAA